MIGLALFAAQAVTPAPDFRTPEPQIDGTVSEEIVVIGRRAFHWRGATRLRNGVHVCRTRRSTRDRNLDAALCGAFAGCFNKVQPLIDEAVARKPPKEEQPAIEAAIREQARACFAAESETAMQALAEQRRAARLAREAASAAQ